MQMWDAVETIKNQKRISPKFNPFKIADQIWFNGLNPQNNLSDDEMDLVQRVIDWRWKTKYDYEKESFSSDLSTQGAYWRELEFCEWVKMVMYVFNNLNNFNQAVMSYDAPSNRFLCEAGPLDESSVKVVQMFCEDGKYVVENPSTGEVALNRDMILKVAKFMGNYVFHIMSIRENMKTIAQKHAMRGSSALLVHLVNDYLMKELPFVRDALQEGEVQNSRIRFGWEVFPQQYKNHGNVHVLEYMDDNEYFNIDPTEDVRFTNTTNARYWEQLEGMGYDDSLGVFTKRQIRDFYREVLGMGRLQPNKPKEYDDIQDFLVDIFKIGANPIKRNDDEDGLVNPIDVLANNLEEEYGYTKQDRLNVQNNVDLRKSQEMQFMEYFGGNLDSFSGRGMYDYMNNRLFYWKNDTYASHVLHPFMYNLKLWNRLNNIIVNGYKDYANDFLQDYMLSKVKFDELFGKFGEARNFWKYNVMDLTGYTTRYEAAIKDEHRDDDAGTVSNLTGYDGLFYPDAAKEFLELMTSVADGNFELKGEFFTGDVSVYGEDGHCWWDDDDEIESNDVEIGREHCFISGRDDFIAQIYSVYWQVEKTTLVEKTRPCGSDGWYFKKVSVDDSFYTRWYSHLNYTRAEYQKIAMQLWYWRDRIKELISTEYPIKKYCLDIQGNSLVLVSTFTSDDKDSNPYLIDLQLT